MRAADRKRKRRAISKQQKLIREKRRSSIPCPVCDNRFLSLSFEIDRLIYTCGYEYKRGEESLAHLCQDWIPVEEMNSAQLRRHIKRLTKASVANERST